LILIRIILAGANNPDILRLQKKLHSEHNDEFGMP